MSSSVVEPRLPGLAHRLSAQEPSTAEPGGLAVPGARKAAILLTSLDGETSAAILRQLSETEVRKVIAAVGSLAKVTQVERRLVLDEYVGRIEEGEMFCDGGVEFATSVLISAFGEDAGTRLADRALSSITPTDQALNVLRQVDARQVGKILRQESPQTVALLVSHLGGDVAARIMAELAGPMRLQVMKRLAALDEVSPELVERIARVIAEKLRSLAAQGGQEYGGLRAAADILNRVDGPTSEELLNDISRHDAALGDSIRRAMFVFEDFLKLGKESMRTLLARVDKKVLTLALKGASPAVKAHFASVMSSGAVELLNEDMQALGAVRLKDVEQAQSNVIAKARELQAQGEITLGTASAEQYVE